jgi:Na+/H+ antiporter
VRGFELILGLVVAATVVAALAERLQAPAPSLLVLAGLAVGSIPGVPDVVLRPNVVALGVLPPLLCVAATDVAISELVPVLRPVIALALGLVAVSAVAVAVVAHALFPQLSLATAFVLGAVLASTDPIAVSALARRLRLPPRLLALVQGESLLNDASSLVLFQVAIGTVTAAAGVSLWEAAGNFLRLGLGGAAVGVGAAFLVRRLQRRMYDPILETVVALLTPYAVFVGAQLLGMSGVTAVVLAGLSLSERAGGVELSSGRTRLQITSVYAVVQFLLETVIFAVIGLELPSLVRRLTGTDQHFLLGSFAIVAVVIVVRGLWVFPASYLPHLRRQRTGPGRPARRSAPRWQVPLVITWVGTRGVVPLAAALSIPFTSPSGAPFPHRDLLLVLTTICILLTLVVQGLTLEPLVQRLGVTEDPAAQRREETLARHAAEQAALARLEELIDVEAIPHVVTARLRDEQQRRLHRAQASLDAIQQPPGVEHMPRSAAGQETAYRAVRRDLLATQAAELFRLRDAGAISEAARRRVQRTLDIQDAELGDD